MSDWADEMARQKMDEWDIQRGAEDIAAALREARRKGIEEAAGVAEKGTPIYSPDMQTYYGVEGGSRKIAFAIRALLEKSP